VPIQKQNLSLSFATSVDTKTDPLQVAATNMLSLQNIVYTKDKQIQKRNGFMPLGAQPVGNPVCLSTFQNNLVSIGNLIETYSSDSEQWINKGLYQPLSLNVTSLVRSSYAQSELDSATAPNGLVCVTYLNGDGNTYYQICDSTTGQTFAGPTALPSGAVVPRVFVLGNYFIVTYLVSVGGTPHLRYIPIPTNNVAAPGSPTDISALVSGTNAAYDGYVLSNQFQSVLFIAWNGSDSGGAVRVNYLLPNLVLDTVKIITSQTANLLSVTVDSSIPSTPVVWVTWYTTSSTNITATALNSTLGTLLAPTTVDTGNTLTNITAVSKNSFSPPVPGNSTLYSYYEVENDYSYEAVRSDFIRWNTLTQSGTAGTAATLLRSVGLASEAFLYAGVPYMLVVYGGAFQPTYFLINGSGDVVARVAYSNGGGYVANQILPSVSLSGNTAQIAYQFKDLLTAVNKNVQVAGNINGIYSQTGVNLASFTFGQVPTTAEIGNNLHISGGLLWMYDGNYVGEHGFNVWPEDILATWSATGGSMAAKPDGSTNTNAYYYQVTYEWTDSQGNIHRSAPSIPIAVTTSGSGTTGSVVLDIPTLRLTYKNLVRIVIYRWSVAQEVFYQVTSQTTPLLNNPAVDSVTYTDTQSDAQILGNQIVYTAGGVLEDICAPGSDNVGLFQSRLFLVDAEDRNTLWFSKQVIEGVPAEMTDLLTYFTAPTSGAQGNTGVTTAISAMDDKFVFFKKDACYYFNGTGPDNTGANNGFVAPLFITGIVGSTDQLSIVFQQNGLMFQSDKGIWILGRDLNVAYIGAPVEAFNGYQVNGALSVPGTNQIRFTLSGTDQALMYDYFFARWSSFVNVPAVSSVLYQGLHTYLSSYGTVLQETSGAYLDNSIPVTMSFTTAWFNLAGLQGYERAYFFYLMGQYISPHKLQVLISYDYNPSPAQSTLITPANYGGTWGSETVWGAGSSWGSTATDGIGGEGVTEQWRVFFDTQRTQAFQITVQEVYDPSFNTPAGAGLLFNGINIVYGVKRGYRPGIASRSTS
jgi:hypothetical protein